MKIKSDMLRIRTVPFDDKGQKMEPEQQPVQRVIHTDSPATMRNGQMVGTLPTNIVMDTTVAEMVPGMRRPCFSCKHFDRRNWKELFRLWSEPTAPIEKRRELNAIRAALLETNNAEIQHRHDSEEGMMVEHAISTLGICRPLTEIDKNPVIVYPKACCPANLITADKPHGLYEPKNKDNERMGSQTFDNLMKAARGEKFK